MSVALDAALGARSVTLTTGAGVVSVAGLFSVTQPVLQSIGVTPPLPNVPLGLTQQFTAIGTYDNALTADLTASVTWSSLVPAVATISNTPGSNGLATSVSAGTTTIIATLANVAGSATLTVGPPAIATVVVTPVESTILEGRSQQFTATATLTNGVSQDVTSVASWTSASAAVAVVDAQGLVTAVAAGSTTITATHSGVFDAAAVTVRAALRLTKYAYVVNQNSNSISAYTVDAENGSLTPVPNSPFATGVLPASATVHPSGKFVYTPNLAGNTVSVYAVQPTGALQTVSLTTLPAGSAPFFVALAPSGQFAYVVNRAAATVSVHAVNAATGTLTPVAGATIATGSNPIYAAMHPSGRFLFVANADTANVSAFSVNQTTGLLTVVPGSPFAAGTVPVQPVIDPTGRYLYVVNQNSNNVNGYTIDPVTGALLPISGSPYAAGSFPVGIQVDPAGRFAYVTNDGSDNISVFSINSAEGFLTPIAGSPFAGGDRNFSLALMGSGRNAIVANNAADTVSVYALNQLTGAPSAIPGSPFAAGDGPRFVAVVNERVDGTATLASIAVSQQGPTAPAGTALQFTAIGTYSDGSQRFLTASAVWSTTDGTIATISNTAGSNGRATALTPGLTTITATLNGISGTATLTVSAAPLISIAVTPSNTTIQVGMTQQFVATGTYADNSTQVITNAVTWNSSLPAVATISNAAATRGVATGVGAGQTGIIATLDGITGTTQLVVTAAPVLASVAPASGAQGQTLNVTVTGQSTHFLQGQTTASFGEGITVNGVTVTSSTSATVNVSIAIGAAPGARTVTMTTGAEVVSSAAGAFTVTIPVLVQIAVDPPLPNVPLGLTQQFTATGTYDNALSADVTASVTWSSSVQAVATINATGLASTVTRGSTTISATLGAVSGTATLSVIDPALTAIAIVPGHASIIETQTQQFIASGTYTDGSIQDVTASALWSTGQPSIATIAAGGLASGTGAGFTAVTATQGAISGSATIYVRRAMAPHFAFVANQTGSVSVFTIDALTGGLTRVAGSPFAAGTFPWGVAATPDQRFVYLTNQGGASISGYAINARTGALTPLPGSPFTATGQPRGLAAHPSGRFLYVANAGTGRVIGYAINQSTGALIPVPGTGAAVGSFTSLVAAHPSGAFLYAVAGSGNTLASIAVNDTTGEITTVGSTATDTSPAGLAVDPTGRYAFVGGGTPATMRVYALDQSSGVASPLPANTISIPFAPNTMAMHPSGSFMYAGSGSTTFLGFRVNSATGAVSLLSSPSFSGNAYAVAVDPSGLFGYRTNDAASNVSAFGIDSTGMPTAVAGSPFATGGTPRLVDISGAASALNATLTAIEVRPASVSVQTGGAVQFTARGIYSDGSARFLTMSATWSSLDPTVAIISNAAGSNGLATALTPGITTISATFNGITGTASLSVTAPPLVSIAVTPPNPSIPVGATQQFAATGTYADNSTQVITNAVTWSSSLPSIATIGNDAATRGRATGVDVGETIISATFDGVTGSTGLTVTAGNALILSVAPNQGGAGQTLTLLVTGRFTNFVQGLTTASLGSNVVVNSVTVASATSATVNVSIGLGATVGSRSLTITTGAESVSTPFIVLPAPALIAITPDNAQQGQTLDVAITGENTHFAAGQTTVSFGADVAVTAVQVASPTSLVATISIGANAVASPRTVTAVTGSETVSLADGFTVLSSVALLSPLSPGGGQQGQQVVVQVVGVGTHFVQGQTTATFGQGISIQSLTVTSATSAMVTVLIDPLANIGSREVTLATGTEFATRSNGFTVFASPARLESFSPTTARQGDSLTIEVTGFDTHFAQSATNASFGQGIVVGNVRIASPTHASVDIAVDVTATLGLRTIVLTTGGENASNGDRFQILPGIPQVASITPNTGVQGGTATVSITARFTNFVPGQTNVSFGTGIFVTNFTVTSPTTANATITISPTTPTGARNVTLTTGGEIVTATGGFSVLNGPAVITQVSPASATQGETVTVEITGQSTHFAEGVTSIGFAPPQPSIGIQVLSLTITSPTSATAQIEIPADAVPGLWSISVTTSGEVATRSGAFTVLPGTPVLSGVSPASAAQGQSRDVVVTGRFTTFVQGQTTASFGEGVTVNSVTVTSSTSATVNLSVGVLAHTGLRNVTVTTGPQIVSRTNGFSVVPGPARITSVSPNQAQQGQTLIIDLIAADTHFQQGVTTLTLSGATTVSLTVTSATTATAEVTIDPFATPGLMPVTMTTVGENASLNAAFTILPGTPVITIVTPGSGQQGQALDVDVTGRFTHFVNGQTTANFGAGVTTNTVSVTGPTSATVNVTIDPLTLTGLRTVTMTTGPETATGLQLFSVVPGIAILTGLSPAEGQQGQTVDVAITGGDTHFAAGTTTADFGGGVDINRFTVTSPTQASANITIQPLAAIGLRTVVLRTAGESALRVNGFNVLAGTPIVTSVTPNGGRQGESVSVTILGQYTNFQQGLTTANFGAGVTVTALTINGPTSATATLSIDPITPIGGRLVTLTTGTQIAGGGSFIVTAGPAVLTQVTPDNGRQGQSHAVSVVGLNTHFAAGVTTATISGSGASAGVVAVTSPTAASFTITLEPFATPGPRTITLTTAGEIASIVDGFTVVAGTPRITALTPVSGTQGQSLQVTITGQFTSFQTGQTTIAFGDGIQVTSVNVTSATSATASITISPLAAIGGRTVVATTNQETASSAANAFAVQPGNAALSALTPNAGRQAELLSVDIVGTGTHFAAGTSSVDFGSAIAVTGFTVTSPTQATASISIAGTTAIGARTVTVTTAGETAQIVNGFTVLVGAPRVTQLSPVSGRQAQTLDVTVTGQFTNFVQGQTTANFGVGIATTALAVTSPTVAVATIAIQPSATVGVRSVTVTTGSEVATSIVGFNVTPGQPVVASVTPNSGVQGQSLTVAVAGQFTTFTAGVSTVSLGSGINIGAVTVNGPTQLTVPITVSAGASTGPRTATVTTNGEVATLSNAFTVTAGSPSITILNPNVGSPNSSVQVQITGQFTSFVGGQTVANFGPNISVGGGAAGAAGPVAVSGPTTATAQLTIQAGASLGARDVTVQTGAETITVFGGFTVATNDGIAPAVLRVSPASGATSVPINTEAEVEFTEPVDRASATTTSIGLRDDTTSAIVPATVVLDATGRIATIRPTALLSVNHGYTVLLSFNTRIRDAAGNQMFQTSAGSFTTGLSTDTTGPSLLVASPAQAATAVPLNVDVVLQFDKPINPVTRAAGVQVSLAGAPVLGTYSLSTDNRVLTFQPTANLGVNTTYTVTLTAQLTDVAGNSLTNPGVLSFTTGTAPDTTGPAIAMFLPAANADHVGTNVLPYVAFNERINPISVRADNVQLTYSQTGLRVPVTHTVSPDRMSVTLTPVEPLVASAQYQVSLSSVTDLAGNFSSFTTWTFFTGVLTDTTPPVVESVSPLAASSNVPVNVKINVRFNEPVANPSLQPGTIAVVPSGGSAVAGSLLVSADRRTATFTAAASLAASTAYTVVVTGFRDDTGNVLTPFTSTFTTRASTTIDSTGPTVTTVQPANGATGVSVIAPVILTFNEPIDPTTMEAGIAITVSNQTGEIAGSFLLSGSTVTFTPLTPLPGDTLISLTLNGQLRDLAGNGTPFFSSSFRTAAVADTTPPTVLSVLPTQGTTDVGSQPDVVLTFSESLNAATVSNTTFGLFANDDWLGISVLRSADNRTITLKGTLPANSLITVVATGDVTDLSNNHLADFSSSFTTAPAVETVRPSIVRQRPGVGVSGVRADTPIVLYASEPLDAATVSPAVFVAANGILVSGSAVVSGGGQTITFTPDAPFAPGTHVEIFVEPTAIDLAGNLITRYQGNYNVAVDPATSVPALVRTNPSTGQQPPRNVRIELEFNEELNPTTVNAGTVVLRENGSSTVAAAITVERGGRVIRIAPSAELNPNTFYTYQVTTGVRDLQGTPLAFTINGSFTTLATSHVDAPSVVSVSPPMGAIGVGVNAEIHVEFTEAVNPISVTTSTISILDGGGTILSHSIVFSELDRAVTIVPHRSLAAGQTIQVVVNGVEDAAGNLVVPHTSSFGTAAGPDVSAPTLVRTSPTNGESNVPVNSLITLEFNEPIDPTTVADGTSLVDSANSLPVAVDRMVSGDRIVTLRPLSPLAVSHSYQLRVLPGLKDLAGNASANVNYSFTTALAQDVAAPVVVATSPSTASTAVPTNVQLEVLFNEPISGSSLGQLVLRRATTVVGVTTALSDSNRRLTISPTVPLQPSSAHALTITGVTDLSGNVAATQTLTFTTGPGADLVYPIGSIVSPPSGASGVGTNASVLAQFSERVNPISVNAASFRLLRDGSAPVSAAIVVATDGLSATLMPASPLTSYSSYSVQLTGGVTDLVARSIGFSSSSFKTGGGIDSTGPAVVEVSPANGTAAVPVNARVVIRVDEPVSAVSLQPGTVVLTPAGASAVPGTLSFSSSDRQTIMFLPASALLASTSYTVTVNGLRDDAGNIVASFSSTFSTRASTTTDITGPSVVSQTPVSGATGVGVTTPVVITFSEPVDPTSVPGSVAIRVLNQTGNLAGSFSVNGPSVTFTPLTPYPGDTVIQTSISSGGIRDFAGNPGQFFTATFRTAAVSDATPPTVLSVSPLNGAADLGPYAEVVLTFSESLDANTVNASTFGLFANNAWLSATVNRSSDNRTVTLTATLPSSSVITVVATGDVTDLSGNHLADFRSSFTTLASQEATRPMILRQRPAAGTVGVRADVPIVLYVDEPLLPATVPSAVFVAADGVLVTGVVSVSGGGQVITFVPSSPFAAGTHVEVFVETTATDVSGNALIRYQSAFTVASDPAVTAPTLLGRNPSSTSGVPRNVRIELEFSEPLNPASLSDSSAIVRNGSGLPVPASVTLARGGRVIRITPATVLDANASYSYQLLAGIVDLQGTPVPSFISGSFTTAATSDTIPPTVTGVSPPAGAANVGVNTTIYLAMSESVNPLSVNEQTVAVSDSSGALLASSIVFSDSDRSITFSPHRALRSGETVQIAVDGIEDVAGNLVAPQTTAFATRLGADVTPPTVASISPYNGQLDAPVNVVPAITLSESIDPTSIAGGIVLRDNQTGGVVQTSVSLGADNRTVSIHPSTALQPNEPYGVSVTAGLRDLSGNPASPTSFSFRTSAAADTTAPEIVGISPSTGATAIPINAQMVVQFDEPIAEYSLAQVVLRTGANGVPITMVLSDSNRRLTILPTVPLLGLTSYTLTIAGVADTSGNVAATEVISFVTAVGSDLRSPDVVTYSPTANASGVSVNTVVVIQFSERVNPLSVVTSSFRLLQNGSITVAATLQVAPDGLSATLTPNTPLQPLTGYAIVTTGISDLVGRTTTFETSAFTTGAGGQ
jgi:6-phosphogluconolactonase (cycloisomerase 2 family)